MSAYAKTIRREVEARAKKPVRVGSIVVALSRIRHEKTKQKPLVPNAEIEDLSVKSGLAEISFERTRENLARLRTLYGVHGAETSNFFMVTHGAGEITIVAPDASLPRIARAIRPAKPKAVIKNLVALTVRFRRDYVSTPNVIFSFVRHLALKRINIVEIVSTYTELTFLIDQRDLQETFLALNKLRAAKTPH